MSDNLWTSLWLEVNGVRVVSRLDRVLVWVMRARLLILKLKFVFSRCVRVRLLWVLLVDLVGLLLSVYRLDGDVVLLFLLVCELLLALSGAGRCRLCVELRLTMLMPMSASVLDPSAWLPSVNITVVVLLLV